MIKTVDYLISENVQLLLLYFASQHIINMQNIEGLPKCVCL